MNLSRWLRKTPVVALAEPSLDVVLKLELMQVTGSFKARAALTVLLRMNDAERARGVVAASAGNHAIAVAFAARELGSSAKVVMPTNANPARVARVRAFGAELELVADIATAFARAQAIAADEGRTFVHPFEGEAIAAGTATLGDEIVEQVPDVQAVVVPIGGGGLAAGVASAVKRARPDCLVFGVEPFGADSMTRSLAAGSPQRIEKVDTIADSLGAPYAMPYSFDLVRRHVDAVVRVDDDVIRDAMRRLFDELRLVVEPAGAASTAASLGPLAERLRGLRTVAIVCGSNIDLPTFAAMLATESTCPAAITHPALRALVRAEVAAGNVVRETSRDFPDPGSAFVLLAEPFRTTPDAMPNDVEHHAVNDPHWWKAEYVTKRTPRQIVACAFGSRIPSRP